MSHCSRGVALRTSLRLLTALLCLLTPGIRAAGAEVKLTSEAKNGSKISDIYTLVIHAESKAGIDKVEFQIDGMLRFTDTSVPYEYEWDTIADKEGEHKITITAYDSDMRTKNLTFTLVIDNELGMGADALAKQAMDAIKNKDYETANKYSRRAFKADPDNLTANRVLAMTYASKQDWDKAVTTLEKVKIPEDDTETMAQLASYRLQRAMMPINGPNFVTDLAAIQKLRLSIAELALKKVVAQNTPMGNEGKVTAEGHTAIGDALFTAARLREAAAEYAKCGDVDSAPVETVSRLALVNSLNKQPSEALRLTRALIRQKKDDSAIRAVYALTLLRARQFPEARAAIAKDVQANLPAALIVAAFADAAMGKRKDAVAEAKSAVTQVPTAGDAQFALAMVSTDGVESDRALHRALALAPFQHGPILGYTLKLMLEKNPTTERVDQALGILGFVLKSDPDNIIARWMESLLYMQTKRMTEAETMLDTLLKQDSKALDFLIAGAVFCRMTDHIDRMGIFLEEVRKQEPDYYTELAAIKSPQQALFLFGYRTPYRTEAFLTPTSLYPPKATAER